ncbi:hypothetical protein HMPREF1219_01054 [Corynebacterium pyruviciproducens ATCC BAA-1742]|uniref:Carrier domain-containing protein n=1 Tax=Corynebacterium pyruviciproducens ATCC BAA-1742 TaxID=1125779 RepID=S3A052_9CORY|nr:acyl carrier protein [Corynebacterium pyruviciproducens]EPD69724.1 hypothetical protein HMPREF1219_01054 [Corynebacterium pyruviciproducens ATCC BAA-1742]
MADTNTVLDIIAHVAGREVSPTDTLRDGLGLDTLALIELAVRVEDATGVRSDTFAFSSLSTVGDVLAHVAEHTSTD